LDFGGMGGETEVEKRTRTHGRGTSNTPGGVLAVFYFCAPGARVLKGWQTKNTFPGGGCGAPPPTSKHQKKLSRFAKFAGFLPIGPGFFQGGWVGGGGGADLFPAGGDQFGVGGGVRALAGGQLWKKPGPTKTGPGGRPRFCSPGWRLFLRFRG